MSNFMPKCQGFFSQRVLHIMVQILVVGGVLSVILGSAVLAQDNERILKIVNTACVACHSADGNSLAPTFPKLSAQHAGYLEKQIKDYQLSAGKSVSRVNAMMNPQVSMLSDDDIQGLATYFSKQKIKPALARRPELENMAKKLYRGGDRRRGIAACAGCHGPTGAGIPAQYPRIAGQFSEYTKTTLMAFRSGERDNDTEKVMQMTARLLTDKEIEALSDYIAGLRMAK